MKSERNIFIAFILNLGFSLFEFFGGLLTGSIAIISDAIHDMGDAASIGISYILEKKSKRQPDNIYTYGYTRYSAIGSLITTVILMLGSAIVIYNAIRRMHSPVPVHYSGMVVFAIIGICVNLIAAIVTREGNSLNQKAVNLHMLEDVLGWVVVLVGAIAMHFTDITLIDPIMSIAVALYIFKNALKNLKDVLDLFLEKIPAGISISDIQKQILTLDGIVDVHHIHIRSIDGIHNCATMHIVTNSNPYTIKQMVRSELNKHGISHITLELETPTEHCHNKQCQLSHHRTFCHHHHY